MATPPEKLAQSLDVLHQLQKQGAVAIRSADLSRTHRKRLVQNGFLQEVIKGWYIPARPDETAGESTAWEDERSSLKVICKETGRTHNIFAKFKMQGE